MAGNAGSRGIHPLPAVRLCTAQEHHGHRLGVGRHGDPAGWSCRCFLPGNKRFRLRLPVPETARTGGSRLYRRRHEITPGPPQSLRPVLRGEEDQRGGFFSPNGEATRTACSEGDASQTAPTRQACATRHDQGACSEESGVARRQAVAFFRARCGQARGFARARRQGGRQRVDATSDQGAPRLFTKEVRPLRADENAEELSSAGTHPGRLGKMGGDADAAERGRKSDHPDRKAAHQTHPRLTT